MLQSSTPISMKWIKWLNTIFKTQKVFGNPGKRWKEPIFEREPSSSFKDLARTNMSLWKLSSSLLWAWTFLLLKWNLQVRAFFELFLQIKLIEPKARGLFTAQNFTRAFESEPRLVPPLIPALLGQSSSDAGGNWRSFNYDRTKRTGPEQRLLRLLRLLRKDRFGRFNSGHNFPVRTWRSERQSLKRWRIWPKT